MHLACAVALVGIAGGCGTGIGDLLGNIPGAGLVTRIGGGLGGLAGGLGGLGGLGGGALGGPQGFILGLLQNIQIINPADAELQAPLGPEPGFGFIIDQDNGRPVGGETLLVFDFPPSAGAVGPDGLIYFAERGTGRVRAFDPATNSVAMSPVLDLPVNSAGHRGLNGICFAPDGGRLFVTYTASTTSDDTNTEPEGLENRVSSFPFATGAVAGGETVLMSMPCRNEFYASAINTIGHCHIGPDGHLYFAHGDLDARLPAQDVLAGSVPGKILRLTLDGGIPSDNPYGATNPIYQLGLRNPLSFGFDTLDGTVWNTDRGSVVSDELNSGGAGTNFGWPLIQGKDNTDPEGIVNTLGLGLYTAPRIDFGANAKDPTGVMVLRGSVFGDDLDGDVLVIETAGPQSVIYRYDFSLGFLVIRDEFFRAAVESGPAVDMFVGPGGLLYMLTRTHLYRLFPA